MMNDISIDSQVEQLKAQIQNADQKLEETSQKATAHAFNLAISVGIIPAAVVFIIVFIVAHGSLPSLLITVIIIGMALAFFASLVANQSRSRSLQRVFDEQILPEISQTIQDAHISFAKYKEVSEQNLPEGSILLKFLSQQVALEASVPEEKQA